MNLGVRGGSEGLFKYHHVGIGNEMRLCWESRPTQFPNANGFRFWLNPRVFGHFIEFLNMYMQYHRHLLYTC